MADGELGWGSCGAGPFPVCVNIFLRKSWLPLCVGTALLRSCCKPLFEPRLAGSCVCGLLHLCVNIVSPELHQGVRNVWWGFESSCPNCFSEWCWPNQNGGRSMGKLECAASWSCVHGVDKKTSQTDFEKLEDVKETTGRGNRFREAADKIIQQEVKPELR